MATEFISNSWLMPTNANAEANRVSNYSLDFDSASNQSINCGNISALTSSSNFSISGWFTQTTLDQYTMLFGQSGGVSSIVGAYTFTDGNMYVDLRNGSSTYGYFDYSTVISADTWFHLAMVFDGSGASNSDRLKLYINNSEMTLTYNGTIPTSTSSSVLDFNIGIIAGYSKYWLGKITEISIFDYSLSASQVTELYGTGSAIGNPMAITNGRKPVAYYPLGNAAFNGEFLTPNGAEQDYVFDFNGSSEHILLPQVNTTGAYTISCWVKSTGANYQMIYNEDEGVRSPSGSDRNFFYTIAFGKLRWANWFTTGYVDVESSNTINDGEWHHTVGLWDGTTNTGGIKLFIDGILRGTATAGATTRENHTMANNKSIIGGQYSSYDFDGNMSNFQVYTTGLTYGSASSLGDVAAGEIATLYNNGTPYKGTQPQLANLKVWYELDASATFDGSNWSIPDASSNSNTGTSSGMTAANLVQSDLIINAPYDPFSLSFDGIDESISIGNVWSGLLGSYTWSPFTISFWYKGTNPIVGATHTKGLFGFNATQQIGFYDGYAGAANVRLYLNFGSTNNYWTVGSNGTRDLFDDNWHNVVIVFPSGSNDGVDPASSTLYIDNQLITKLSSGDATAPAAFYTWNKFNIMNADWSNLGGQLSNVVLWGNDQTSEISNIYNNGTPASSYTNTPDGWWRLGAVNTFYNSTTTEFTVLDEVGTNDGTSVNMEQGDLVDGVGATGSGLSSGMGSGENRIGSAPFSENNAVSYNLSVLAKSTSTPT